MCPFKLSPAQSWHVLLFTSFTHLPTSFLPAARIVVVDIGRGCVVVDKGIEVVEIRETVDDIPVAPMT